MKPDEQVLEELRTEYKDLTEKIAKANAVTGLDDTQTDLVKRQAASMQQTATILAQRVADLETKVNNAD